MVVLAVMSGRPKAPAGAAGRAASSPAASAAAIIFFAFIVSVFQFPFFSFGPLVTSSQKSTASYSHPAASVPVPTLLRWRAF